MKYLEEAEEKAGQKLDRFGLNQEQRKQFDKDRSIAKKKWRYTCYTWLIVGVLVGLALFFGKGKLSLDEETKNYLNVFVCIVIGLAWIGFIFLFIRYKVAGSYEKKLKARADKNRVPYVNLPFEYEEKEENGCRRVVFRRCPVCGYKLNVTDKQNNNGAVYMVEMYQFKYDYSSTVYDKSHIVSATPRIEHTSYQCSRCAFAFKVSYKAEYKYQDKYITKDTIVHNRTVEILGEMKPDAEAQEILKPHTKEITTFI